MFVDTEYHLLKIKENILRKSACLRVQQKFCKPGKPLLLLVCWDMGPIPLRGYPWPAVKHQTGHNAQFLLYCKNVNRICLSVATSLYLKTVKAVKAANFICISVK